MLFHLLTSVINAAGGESPLAVESPLSEFTRFLLPLNTLAVGYLVKVFKDQRTGSSDTHARIIRDIAEANEGLEKGRKEVSAIRHDVKDLRQELIAAGYLKANPPSQFTGRHE